MAEDFKPVQRISFYDVISKNKRNSILLIIVVFAILVGILYVFAMIYSYYFIGSISISPAAFSFTILPVAVFVLILEVLPAYYYGDRLVLKDAGAYKPDPRKHIYLMNIVEGLSIATGIKRPNVYIIPSKDINAFVTGRDPEHASIAVTEGGLEKLSRKELEGVIGHEMSHIKNYDIRYMLVVASVVGSVAILSQMFLSSIRHMNFGSRRSDRGGGIIIVLIIFGVILALVAPIAVRLVQLAYSRQREFLADASGVEITRNPSGLAGALQRIKEENKKDLQVSEAISHLFIDDPRNTFVDNIFETHPPIEERIGKLRMMGG